jgi:hypothetical protein
VVFGDLSGLLFEKSFILSASQDYGGATSAQVDDTQHLTNLSINKKYPGHPGQVPCWMTRECPLVILPPLSLSFFPHRSSSSTPLCLSLSLTHTLVQLFDQISAIWSDLIAAASPFLAQQHSSTHYEFVGLDILVDSHGLCHLLEVNRCPGLESSNNRCKPQEDELYDEMMSSFFEILFEKRRTLDQRLTQSEQEQEPVTGNKNLDVDQVTITGLSEHHWRWVREAAFQSPSDPVKVYENLFNWRAFTKKSRSEIVV